MQPETKNLPPGFYHVGDELRLGVPELLRHFGYPDTPENGETLTRAAKRLFREWWPDVEQRVVESTSDKGRR
jgi:hypothetical protein